MMIVGGYAAPAFPRTDRSNPSPAVGIIPVRSKVNWPPPVGLPLFIHWTQWEAVVVPCLEEDLRATGWRGTLIELGQAVTLMNNIVGPGGDIVFTLGLQIGLSPPTRTSLGTLYACDPFDFTRVGGRTSGYLNAMMGVIYEKAVEAGY